MSEQSYCPNCGAPGVHYVVPGLGEAGFFICSPDTSKPPAATVAPCYKCKQPMSMTPVCTACGIIPIAMGSFEQLHLEIDRLKAELLWCVEVLESQRHEMDNEGNISTHVSEGKLEELQAIVANQRKEQKS